MSSRLSPTESPQPHPLRIRDGRVDDAEAVEAVHYDSREAVYAGRVADWPPPGPGREGRVERWSRWLADPAISCIVGEVDGEIVGFSTIRPAADDDADERTAEMPTLYVRPDSWRRGYGAALCRAAVQRARVRGFTELTLWVVEVNEAAAAFYEALGFTFDGTTKMDELPRERLAARRYRIDLTRPPAS